MDKLMLLQDVAPMIAVITLIGVGGWIFTTWLRIKNGYPLENSWGQSVYPKNGDETTERIKLLTSDNAQLRAELGALKDRLATVERIVTDSSYRLHHEIDQLRGPSN